MKNERIILKVKDQKEPLQLDFQAVSADIHTKIGEIDLAINLAIGEEYEKVTKDATSINKYLDLEKTNMIDVMTRGLEVVKNKEGELDQNEMKKQLTAESIALYKPIFESIQKGIVNKYKIIKAIRYCKAMIDVEKLNDANKELIESEETSEFWRSQALKELQKAIDYFRDNQI